MKHAKTHASSQLSEGDRRLFELVEGYKKNGGDFGDEAKLGFRQALAERLKSPPEPDPAEIIEFYRMGVLRLLKDIERTKRTPKKRPGKNKDKP